MEQVDRKRLALGAGVELSYLKKRTQELVYRFCYGGGKQRSLRQTHAKTLRAADRDPNSIVDEAFLEELLAPKQRTRMRTVKLELSTLREYFPAGTPEEVVVQTIRTALAAYFERR